MKKFGWIGVWLALLLIGCEQLAATETPVALIAEPPAQAAFDSLAALEAADPPQRDLVALAARLQGVEVGDSAEKSFVVGDEAPFNFINEDSGSNETTNAVLRYQSDLLNLWIESGVTVSERNLQEAAQRLEMEIIPTTRNTFGTEVQPGIDGDGRVTVLHLKDVGGSVAGYFSSADAFPNTANPFSNEREMLYINLKYAPVGSTSYYQVLAHEMQHMIHWSTDSNETTWLDEGLAELSAHISGYPDSDFIRGYADHPDTQLTHFSYEDADFAQNYGASYLFAGYLLDRFGAETVRAIVERQENGIAGIDAVLLERHPGMLFETVFADWIVATYLAGRDLDLGSRSYTSFAIPRIDAAATHRRLPVSDSDSVAQFGADFIEIESDSPVTVTFTGTQQTRLIDAEPFSGEYYMTTVPADDSDLTLTRAFDLTGVPTATLVFQNWYEIENGWDYGYVLASADNGVTWDFLETIYTSTANPYGNSYGPGLTGTSGRSDSAEWAEQRTDLTPYAGGNVLIRFEYITDDAVYEDGWAIDDIAVPEIAYFEDFEDGNGDWETAGFVRHTNQLPHTFLVQAIRIGNDGELTYEKLLLDDAQQGQFYLPLGDGFDELVIAVSGTTPITAQRAAYSYAITEATP